MSSKDPLLSAAGRLGARRRWGDAPRVVRLSDLSPDQARLTLSLVELFRAKKAAATTDANVVAASAESHGNDRTASDGLPDQRPDPEIVARRATLARRGFTALALKSSRTRSRRKVGAPDEAA